MKPILTLALSGFILIPLSIVPHATGSVAIELVEVPASEAAAASSLEERVRPLTLSEQFATTRIGSLRESEAEPSPLSNGEKITIYECRELLAKAIGGPDRAALVIELARRRAYLMIDGMMVLETPVAVPGNGKEVPLGWFPVSSRSRDTPVSDLYEVKPAFWLKLGDSGFGLHADELSGYPASGGCVRMPRAAIGTVFQYAAPGTMVYICSTWLAPVPTGTLSAAMPITGGEPTPSSASEVAAREGTRTAPSELSSSPEIPALEAPVAATESLQAAIAPEPAAALVEKAVPPLPVTAPPVTASPKGMTPRTPAHQVIRVRHILGGFGERTEASNKPLIPVTGRIVASGSTGPATKAPAPRAAGNVEVLRVRNLLGGQSSPTTAAGKEGR